MSKCARVVCTNNHANYTYYHDKDKGTIVWLCSTRCRAAFIRTCFDPESKDGRAFDVV